jgi:hypothetical protein
MRRLRLRVALVASGIAIERMVRDGSAARFIGFFIKQQLAIFTDCG